MRIALVYDRLFPQNIGGLERYYDALARGLAASNTVSYITQGVEEADPPERDPRPYRVVTVAPPSSYYSSRGNRRIWPTLRFGLGVFIHLLRHSSSYDVIHCASFPFFSVIAARLACGFRRRRPKLVVDWLEVWTLDYWIAYTGRISGRVGYAIQQLCMRAPDQGLTYSALHEARLGAHRKPVLRLTGLATEVPAEPIAIAEPRDGDPNVVFAGRHIPEKQAALIPEVIQQARRSNEAIRCTIIGDGPERAAVARSIEERDLASVVRLPGFVSDAELNRALQSAACLLLPSLREGYGLIVIEAAAYGTPCVTIDAPDNAAKELVVAGVNGYVVDQWAPGSIAEALVKVVEDGADLRVSTRQWYRDHWHELSVESSVEQLDNLYRSLVGGPNPAL
jgi:glycosyltransferase involved in cell wall biosynthesis